MTFVWKVRLVCVIYLWINRIINFDPPRGRIVVFRFEDLGMLSELYETAVLQNTFRKINNKKKYLREFNGQTSGGFTDYFSI